MPGMSASRRLDVTAATTVVEITLRLNLSCCTTSEGRCPADFDGNTYRAVYTIRFTGIVYVLHAFQKKAKRGIATPKTDMGLIEQRLKRAEEDYEQWSKSKNLTSR